MFNKHKWVCRLGVHILLTIQLRISNLNEKNFVLLEAKNSEMTMTQNYTLLVATGLQISAKVTSDVCFIKPFSGLYAQVLVIPRNIIINGKPV